MEFVKRNSDYAIRSLAYMAGFPLKKRFSVDSIARLKKVSPAFLHKLFQKLANRGILMSHRGIGGGFSLAYRPKDISVRKVIEIIQGSLAVNKCIKDTNVCGMRKHCSFRKNLEILQGKIIDFLDNLTLEDLAG